MIAAHLGVANEDEINDMSFVFFNSVLTAIGRKLNYQSVSNLYGNSFCKDAGKYISEANPLTPQKHISSAFLGMLNNATIISKNDTTKSTIQAKKQNSDLDWAEGLFN